MGFQTCICNIATEFTDYHYTIPGQGIDHFYSIGTFEREHCMIRLYDANHGGGGKIAEVLYGTRHLHIQHPTEKIETGDD
jgi:hypothetical protein